MKKKLKMTMGDIHHPKSINEFIGSKDDKRLTVDVDKSAFIDFKSKVISEGTTMRNVITDLIQQYIKQK